MLTLKMLRDDPEFVIRKLNVKNFDARAIVEKVLELGLYQTLKEILKVKGIDAGTCKKPMKSFDPAKLAEVEKLVKDYNL